MTYGILLIVLPPGIELTPLALEVQDSRWAAREVTVLNILHGTFFHLKTLLKIDIMPIVNMRFKWDSYLTKFAQLEGWQVCSKQDLCDLKLATFPLNTNYYIYDSLQPGNRDLPKDWVGIVKGQL